jgi:hypothetical protein
MLTAAQLVTYALQIAKAPGYTTQAADLLNGRLSSLARRYDFDVLLETTTFTLPAGVQSYALPADYIRAHELWYYIGGLPQTMRQLSLKDYDRTNVGSVAMAYPTMYSSDPSTTPVTLYLYPMPNTTIAYTLRYWRQPPDIVNAATSSEVPWFPDSDYLLTVLAGDVMRLTDDTRQMQYAAEAEAKLAAFLKMQGDRENHAQTVSLGNSFRAGGGSLPPSKITGF